MTTTGDLAGVNLHPDFGSVAGGDYGIPYTVVDSAQTPGISVPITTYAQESDVTLYPVPSNLQIENSPGDCPTNTLDRHAIIVDRNKCVAYEMFQAAHCNSGWTAAGGIIWDFTNAEKRPYGFSSADAAGLSIFEGLIRYDEIVSGVINHAIRFTAAHTKGDPNLGYFVAPATHAASTFTGTDNVMGMRIRLKADFDISGYSSTNQIILKAMKQYGMILADNGGSMFFQGTVDARWSDSDLGKLKAVPSSAFEVLQMGTPYDSATAPKGAVPVITSFTASETSVAAGTSVTLTPTITGGSYSFIDKVGFIRGPVTVAPTATTTYLLTSRNAFGSATASVTVTVKSQTAGVPALTFTPVPSQTFGAAPFAVHASSASTGAITYAPVSGPATVSAAGVVTLTGAGTVAVKATQAAAGTYGASTAQTSFAVTAGGSTLVFVPIASRPWSATTIRLATTTKSTGSISYAVVSGPACVSGNVLTLTGVGTVNLKATQAAAGSYAASTATTSFAVTPVVTKLAFVTTPVQTYSATPIAMKASSLSPGAVIYSVVSGPGKFSGNMLTLTGAGNIAVLATQAASGNYSAATATATVYVQVAAAKLTFAPVAAKTFGSAPFTVSATSLSPSPIVYSMLSGHATMSGNTVKLTGTGAVTVRANQVAAPGYGATVATVSFNVTAAPVAGN